MDSDITVHIRGAPHPWVTRWSHLIKFYNYAITLFMFVSCQKGYLMLKWVKYWVNFLNGLTKDFLLKTLLQPLDRKYEVEKRLYSEILNYVSYVHTRAFSPIRATLIRRIVKMQEWKKHRIEFLAHSNPTWIEFFWLPHRKNKEFFQQASVDARIHMKCSTNYSFEKKSYRTLLWIKWST